MTEHSRIVSRKVKGRERVRIPVVIDHEDCETLCVKVVTAIMFISLFAY